MTVVVMERVTLPGDGAVLAPVDIQVWMLVDAGIDNGNIDIDRIRAVAGPGRIQVGADSLDPRQVILRLNSGNAVREDIEDIRVPGQIASGVVGEVAGEPAEDRVVDLVDLHAGFGVVGCRNRCRAREAGRARLEPDNIATGRDLPGLSGCGVGLLDPW